MPRASAGGLQSKPAVSANQTNRANTNILHSFQSKVGDVSRAFWPSPETCFNKKTARLNAPPRPLHLPLPSTFSLPERIVVTNIPRERSQPMNPDFHRNELVPGRRLRTRIDQTQKPKSRAHWNERLVVIHRPRFQQTRWSMGDGRSAGITFLRKVF